MRQHPDSIARKHPRILALLRELEVSLPAGSHQIVDHWESDLCAIGVASPGDPRRLVHVSTYGQAEGTFAFECEAPPGDGCEDYQVVARGEGLGRDALLQKIRAHLEPGRE